MYAIEQQAEGVLEAMLSFVDKPLLKMSHWHIKLKQNARKSTDLYRDESDDEEFESDEDSSSDDCCNEVEYVDDESQINQIFCDNDFCEEFYKEEFIAFEKYQSVRKYYWDHLRRSSMTY
jgi:hypothetical protein